MQIEGRLLFKLQLRQDAAGMDREREGEKREGGGEERRRTRGMETLLLSASERNQTAMAVCVSFIHVFIHSLMY